MGQNQRRSFSANNLSGSSENKAINLVPIDIFSHSSGLGDNSMGSTSGHKQQSDGKLVIPNISSGVIGTAIKRVNKMAETKFLALVLNYVGLPVYLFALAINIENWKGWILTGIAVLYGVARLIFYCVKQWQEAKMRNIDLREKEFELKEKMK